MCLEKKEEEVLPALKIMLTHRYNNYIGKCGGREPPETILTARGSKERK